MRFWMLLAFFTHSIGCKKVHKTVSLIILQSWRNSTLRGGPQFGRMAMWLSWRPTCSSLKIWTTNKHCLKQRWRATAQLLVHPPYDVNPLTKVWRSISSSGLLQYLIQSTVSWLKLAHVLCLARLRMNGASQASSSSNPAWGIVLARICPWWFVCMDKSIIYCRIFHMLRLSWHGEGCLVAVYLVSTLILSTCFEPYFPWW
jgi:hypothetical protein